jgi:hypothetical protein
MTLREELESAIERDEEFGPTNSDSGRRSIPATALRDTILSPTLNRERAKRLRIRICQIVGKCDLEAVQFGLHLQLKGCELTDGIDLSQVVAGKVELRECELFGPLEAEQIDLRWGLQLDGSKLHSGMSLSGARIGGRLSMLGAEVTRRAGALAALIADGARIEGDVFLSHAVAIGGIRMLDAKIGGQFSLIGANLEAPTEGEQCGTALSLQGAEVSEIFLDRATIAGEIALLNVRIATTLSLEEADLRGMPDEAGQLRPALEASRIKVGGEFLCEKVRSVGAMQMVGAGVEGQLDFTKAHIVRGDPARLESLCLISCKIDELILDFEETTGTLDFTDTKVRSLRDAKNGAFLGAMPEAMRLQGFRYESLREPLSAELRLDWVERSQQVQHYPEVYAELAAAYRRIGLRADARKVGIANEDRARKDGALHKRAWNYLLWATVRYGYENWWAAVWLLALIGLGSLLFWVGDDHFVATAKEHPNFSPIIYATDAAIPVLDLGQTSSWTATGWLEWVELTLAISGYALVAAVVAGLAGIFNRDQI